MKALDMPLCGRAIKPRKVLLQNQHGACWWALYLSTPSLEWLIPRYRQWTNGINIIFMFSPTNSLKSSAFSGNYISPLCYVSIDLLLLHGVYHLLGLLNLQRRCNAPEEWRVQLEILNSVQTPKCPLRGQDGRKEKIHFSKCVNTRNREECFTNPGAYLQAGYTCSFCTRGLRSVLSCNSRFTACALLVPAPGQAGSGSPGGQTDGGGATASPSRLAGAVCCCHQDPAQLPHAAAARHSISSSSV